MNISDCEIVSNENYRDNVTYEDSVEFVQIISTPLRNNSYYIIYYINIFNFLIHVMIPYVSLVVMNAQIYKQVSILKKQKNV